MTIFQRLNSFLREQGLVGEGMGTKRSLEGFSAHGFKLFGAAFSLFYLYTTFFGLISQETHVGFYFLGTFILSLMLYGARSRSPQNRISLVDGILILGMGIVIIYYIIEFPSLADRMGGAIRTIDVIFGWFIILLSLEMARRAVGNVIPCIGIFLLIYSYFGPYFPLGLGHSGFSLARIAESLFLSGDGILGSLTNIFASYILIFVILGSQTWC